MPTVPTYDGPQVRTAPLPRVRQGEIDVSSGLQGIARGTGVLAEGMYRADERAAYEAAKLARENEIKAERLAQDEAKTAVVGALSQADEFWREKLDAARLKSPADAAGFTQNVIGEFDNWAKEKQQGLPERAIPMLRDKLDNMRSQIHGRAFQFEVQQRERAIQSNYAEGLDADRRTVMADPTRFEDKLQARLALAGALSLPEDQRQALVEKTRESLALDAAMGLVDKSAVGFLERAGMRSAKGAKGKQGGQQQDAAERIASDPILSNLSPENLRRVTDRASMIVTQQEAAAAQEQARREHQAEVAANKRQRDADAAWKILSGPLLAGHAIDPSSPMNKWAMSAIQGSPYAGAYTELSADAGRRNAAALQPLPTQQAQLDALLLRRNTQGTSPGLDEEIKRREEVLKAGRAEYAAEPLQAAARRGVLPQVAQVSLASIDALTQTIGPRASQAETVRTQAGKAVSPLLDGEAVRLSQMLSTLDAAKRGDAVAKLTSALPPHQAQALAAQLNDKDRPLALAFAAGAMRANSTAGPVPRLILEGQQAIKDKAIKEDTTAQAGLRAQIAAELGDALQGKAREDVIDAARYIYLGNEANGRKSTIQGAVKLAVGGEIVEHNGARIPLPVGIDQQGLVSKLRNLPASAIPVPDGMVYVGSQRLSLSQFLSGLPEAQLEPVSPGRFTVRAGGYLVTDAAQTPIVVDVR